jgi:hypothetical protein
MMVRRRSKSGNSVKLVALVIVIVAALLILKGDIHFLRLSVLNVPAEGVSYDFNDNTFKDWTVTSPHITVENGRIKAGAAGEGSGDTSIYTYNFDYDFEGWSNSSWDESSQAVTSKTIRISVVDQALNIFLKGGIGYYGGTVRLGGYIYKEFDFSAAESVTISLTYQSTGSKGKNILRAYQSVNGRLGELIKTWEFASSSSWTQTQIDLSSDLAGKRVFLYVGAELIGMPPDSYTSISWNLLIDQMVITIRQQAFTTEGYIEKGFSFTKGFETATIQAINIHVDYASEAEWNGFWGVKILESGIEVASFQFTKGYMAWNTFSQDIKQYVAGKTVTIQIGGVITSAARWYIDNVRIEYVLEYPFLIPKLQQSYPANSWANLTVLIGNQRSGVLVTAEIEGKGFQAVSDENGVANIKIFTPAASGSYSIKIFATNPDDGQRYEVTDTLNLQPTIQAKIEAEPSQHYDTPITFIVKTIDPEQNLPIDADTLQVDAYIDGAKKDMVIGRLATGEYQVSFTTKSAGTASVTATPIKSGYYSKPDSVEIAVLQPRIVLTVNIPQEVQVGSEAEIYIKTTTPNGDPLDSDLTVTVRSPDGMTKTYTPARVTKGTYLQTLKTTVEGTYQVTIQASNDIYGSSSGTYTFHATAPALPIFDIKVLGAAGVAIAAIIAVLKRRGTI